MAFSKAFAKTSDKSVYPKWIEVFLSEHEEREEEHRCRDENIRLMKECLDDAKKMLSESKLKDYQSNSVSIAIALFDKRASHAIYWKENMAKEKFDKQNS